MPDITIIGAGLAGMVAGLRLLQRGCTVTIYDSDVRTGGKAGSILKDGRYEDHGYHVFPAWYLNVWSLINELGIYDNFDRTVGFRRLGRGDRQNPQYMPFFTPSVLLLYSILDLISRGDSYLGDESIYGFLHSRTYYTDDLAFQYQDLILKALSDPSYEVSALTMRDVYRQQLRYPNPAWSCTKGNLQEFWVKPIEDAVRKLGGTIHLQKTLTQINFEGNSVKSIAIRDNEGTETTLPVERLLMTVPPEQFSRLVNDAMFRTDPELLEVEYLKSGPQASLNVYLNKKIPGIPRHHISLIHSKYAQTFIDISQIWEGLNDGNTVLQSLASDITTLLPLSKGLIEEEILNELMAYLPFDKSNVVRTVLQTNADSPLFKNDVGSELYRPHTRTKIPNLYMAGDWCISHVNLASMENAVTTGLMAAEAIRFDLKIDKPVTILMPKLYPQWALAVLRFVLTPVAWIAKVVDTVQSLFQRGKKAAPVA
ncbi:MAG TPA: FAD-dependent oxidoreductase [Aggregatilineales bacterium]|nr:FAD-dependent oxidoreductase [Anaerolineales bacterium]HRE47355.1 FAD-dependent oxidoreductase [Aggregatilineales bacterium]